jgi:molecular chaperone DnaK
MAQDNKSLGNFRLEGIPLAPRGVPQIEVTFDIDANGLLSVTAKDKGTGKEQSITVKNASTLDKDELERMVKEAEVGAEQDKEKREKIDLKNQADLLCYQVEKQLIEIQDKISNSKKIEVEESVKSLRQSIQDEDYNSIKMKTQELQKLISTLANESTTSSDQDTNSESYIDT